MFGATVTAFGEAKQPVGLDEMRKLATHFIETGDYPSALDAFQTIVEASPQDPQSVYELAGAQVFLRMYVPAIETINRAIDLEPQDSRHHSIAALVYFQLSRYEDAFVASLAGAVLGDVTAMFTLVGLYERGQGVSQSNVDALRWAIRSANAGHLGAMVYLERIYREGLLGQEANSALADEWHQRLVEAEAALN